MAISTSAINKEMDNFPEHFSEYAKVARRYSSDANPNVKNEAGQRHEGNGRFFDVTEHWISMLEPGECIPTGQAPKVKAVSRSRYGDYSMLLRRKVYPSPTLPLLQLEIQSPSLQRIFGEITGDLASINVYANPIIIKAPYHELYHFREELKAAQKEPMITEHLKGELQLFRDFEDEHLSSTINIKAIEDHKKHRNISSEYLWALFKPRELVVLQTETAATSSIRSCAVYQKFWIDLDSGFWFVQVQYMSSDCRRIGPVERTFTFPLFTGVLPIDSLPIFPLSYLNDSDREALLKTLEENGKEFIKLCKGSQGGAGGKWGHLRGYQGPVWVQQKEYKVDGTGFFDAPADTVRQLPRGRGFTRGFTRMSTDLFIWYKDNRACSSGSSRVCQRKSPI